MEWFLKVLRQYADFKGRARRKEFWMFFMYNTILSCALGLVAVVAEAPEFSPILIAIYYATVLVPSIAVGVRRMHDVGKSGWFILIPIYSFILALTNGDEGSNEWGTDPKEEGDFD